MTAYAWIQTIVIIGALTLSVAYWLRRLFPTRWARLTGQASAPAGCGSGCSRCNGCGSGAASKVHSAPPTDPHTQPIVFHPSK